MFATYVRTCPRGLRVLSLRPSLRASLAFLGAPSDTWHFRTEWVAPAGSFTYTTSSKLVLRGELQQFPLGNADFRRIRQEPGLAYFNKAQFIPLIAHGP